MFNAQSNEREVISHTQSTDIYIYNLFSLTFNTIPSQIFQIGNQAPLGGISGDVFRNAPPEILSPSVLLSSQIIAALGSLETIPRKNAFKCSERFCLLYV